MNLSSKYSSFFIGAVPALLLAALGITQGGQFVAFQRPTFAIVSIQPALFLVLLLTAAACLIPAMRPTARWMNRKVVVKLAGALTGWVLGISVAAVIQFHFGEAALGLGLAISLAVLLLSICYYCDEVMSMLDELESRLFKKSWHPVLGRMMSLTFGSLGLLGLLDLAVKYRFIG